MIYLRSPYTTEPYITGMVWKFQVFHLYPTKSKTMKGQWWFPFGTQKLYLWYLFLIQQFPHHAFFKIVTVVECRDKLDGLYDSAFDIIFYKIIVVSIIFRGDDDIGCKFTIVIRSATKTTTMTHAIYILLFSEKKIIATRQLLKTSDV